MPIFYNKCFTLMHKFNRWIHYQHFATTILQLNWYVIISMNTLQLTTFSIFTFFAIEKVKWNFISTLLKNWNYYHDLVQFRILKRLWTMNFRHFIVFGICLIDFRMRKLSFQNPMNCGFYSKSMSMTNHTLLLEKISIVGYSLVTSSGKAYNLLHNRGI